MRSVIVRRQRLFLQLGYNVNTVSGGSLNRGDLFKLICGAKSAPPGIYTVRCSVPLVVREPRLYSISEHIVASTLQSLSSKGEQPSTVPCFESFKLGPVSTGPKGSGTCVAGAASDDPLTDKE